MTSSEAAAVCGDESVANALALTACRTALIKGESDAQVYLRVTERLLEEAARAATPAEKQPLLKEAERAATQGLALVPTNGRLRKSLEISQSSAREQLALLRRTSEGGAKESGKPRPRMLALRCSIRQDSMGLEACTTLLDLPENRFEEAALARTDTYVRAVDLALALDRCSQAIRLLGAALAEQPRSARLQAVRQTIAIVLDPQTGSYKCKLQ